LLFITISIFVAHACARIRHSSG